MLRSSDTLLNLDLKALTLQSSGLYCGLQIGVKRHDASHDYGINYRHKNAIFHTKLPYFAIVIATMNFHLQVTRYVFFYNLAGIGNGVSKLTCCKYVFPLYIGFATMLYSIRSIYVFSALGLGTTIEVKVAE